MKRVGGPLFSRLQQVCSRSVAKFGEERQNDPGNPIFVVFGYKILSLNFVQNDKDEMLRLNLSRNKGKYAIIKKIHAMEDELWQSS